MAKKTTVKGLKKKEPSDLHELIMKIGDKAIEEVRSRKARKKTSSSRKRVSKKEDVSESKITAKASEEWTYRPPVEDSVEIDFSFKSSGAFDLSRLPDNDKFFEMQEEEVLDKQSALDHMKKRLPPGSIYMGRLEDDVMSMVGSDIENHFYLLPGKEGWNWGLFALVWDDSCVEGGPHWKWGIYGRIKGVSASKVAARFLLMGLFVQWGYDIANPECAAYKEFLYAI